MRWPPLLFAFPSFLWWSSAAYPSACASPAAALLKAVSSSCRCSRPCQSANLHVKKTKKPTSSLLIYCTKYGNDSWHGIALHTSTRTLLGWRHIKADIKAPCLLHFPLCIKFLLFSDRQSLENWNAKRRQPTDASDRGLLQQLTRYMLRKPFKTHFPIDP